MDALDIAVAREVLRPRLALFLERRDRAVGPKMAQEAASQQRRILQTHSLERTLEPFEQMTLAQRRDRVQPLGREPLLHDGALLDQSEFLHSLQRRINLRRMRVPVMRHRQIEDLHDVVARGAGRFRDQSEQREIERRLAGREPREVARFARLLARSIARRAVLQPARDDGALALRRRLLHCAGTQLPWKPHGTRCCSLTLATGAPAKFCASSTIISLRSPASSYQTASTQPSSSDDLALRGTNSGSPAARFFPRS